MSDLLSCDVHHNPAQGFASNCRMCLMTDAIFVAEGRRENAEKNLEHEEFKNGNLSRQVVDQALAIQVLELDKKHLQEKIDGLTRGDK